MVIYSAVNDNMTTFAQHHPRRGVGFIINYCTYLLTAFHIECEMMHGDRITV